MKEEIVETDVLCVGGGIAGLMAAIRARELGADVIVAEKGNVLRSGCGGAGNDHFWCYIPEVHGSDIEPIIERARHSQQPGHGGVSFVRAWYEKSFDIVNLWDSWGIPMKYQGKYEFAGHGYPGGPPLLALKYEGQNQKKILTHQAIQRGARMMNRVMIFDLLGDSRGVTGAVGIDTREDRVIVFKAQSVVLGTGRMVRLYPGPTPGYIANLMVPFNLTGDGRAMAYRVGAELTGLERFARHDGPKYFSRGGQATWVGVVRDPQGKPVGPYVTKPDKRYGDYTVEAHKTVFADYANSGRGPLYMDFGGISNEDYEYMMFWLKHEGNATLLNYLKEEGIDLRKNPLEFMTYEIWVQGGIAFNEKSETSVKGLYAAGDEIRGGISAAATFGWIAGENAAKRAKQTQPVQLEEANPDIEAKRRMFEDMGSREAGPDWKEVNIALQQIMYDYGGLVRSEVMLDAGLSHLQRLKQKAHTTMVARNPHELMRSLEVLNLLDMGELVFTAAKERRETRGTHFRPDYPFANPLMDKALVVKKVNGKPVLAWR